MTIDPSTPAATVLLSHRLGESTHAPLAARFPEVRVIVLPDGDGIPECAEDAAVLYRAGMSHDALRRALERLPGLRWIHTASAGFNWVLIPEVAASSIELTRSANVLDVPIAEYAVATTLALLKGLPGFWAAQRERSWSRPETLRGLSGATVVVIGSGAIGRATAQRFRAFGCRLLGIKRSPAPLPEFDEVLAPAALDGVLAEADVLVVACPLTPETRHLIGAEQLARMKRSAVLVNVGRGEVLVEGELIEALQAGVIAGAALDVFDHEPLPEESPLWGLPNVILTPHVSYLDPRNTAAALEEFVDNLRRFLAGEPLRNTIKSKELGY